MLTKKNWLAILTIALILVFGNAATAYAEGGTAAEAQSQEDSGLSPTIVVGASTAAHKASKNEAEEAVENGKDTEAAQTDSPETKLVSLGIFKTTGYCPCRQCSEGWGRHTCTGAIARASHTIAVDPRVIPYGSRVMINGVIYTAEDRGGAVRGNHIDIFFDTHAQTRQHGTRQAEVFLVK